MPACPFRARKGAQPPGGRGAACPTPRSRPRRRAGCLGGQSAPSGGLLFLRASFVENLPRLQGKRGQSARAHARFFSCFFLFFLRARARASANLLPCNGFFGFSGFPISPFFPVISPFFPVISPFFPVPSTFSPKIKAGEKPERREIWDNLRHVENT